MKILMIGRGVISATYAWALEQAGHEVEFFVRPGRSAAYGSVIDLHLLDGRTRPWGQQVRERWAVSYRETLEADHDFDLIVLSVAHSALPGALDMLSTRLGNATLLIFGNLWTDPLAAIAGLPAGQVAWGFPGGGGGFDADGGLHAGVLRTVVFGTFGTPPNDRERAVRDAFRSAGFTVSEQPDFRGWLWIHFVMDAGIHAQGLRLGSLSDLIGRRNDLREALLTSRELLPLLEARGVDLRRHRSLITSLRAPSALVSGAMSWLISHVPFARISLAAHTDPRAAEPRAICADTLAEARRRGIAAPRLEAAEQYFASVTGSA